MTSAIKEADQWREKGKWAEALSAIKRSEAILASGNGGDQFIEYVGQLREDLEFILRLEGIRLERADCLGGRFNYLGAVTAYTQAFRDYGVDLEELPTDEAVRRLKERSHIARASGSCDR